MAALLNILPLVIGWGLDLIIGDPQRLPHPIVWFGKAISYLDRIFNRGRYRRIKGALCATVLIASVYISAKLLIGSVSNIYANMAIQSIFIFYCLAGTTLIREVKDVFIATDKSLESGRRQVARIVGRDTASLSAQEIRTAALETLAENLSDGVIAPLFWYALLGVPGMLAYKMVNTLDSMIGYRNERYKDFGCAAARIDDAANYLPARITSLLMVLLSGKPRLFRFVYRYGDQHLSPNSGYPEAALAGILECRFGGTHDYFGEQVYKPYIGDNARTLTTSDVWQAIALNRKVEFTAVALVIICRLLLQS